MTTRVALLLALTTTLAAQAPRQQFRKQTERAMRDGVRLHTEIYVPLERKGPLPILLERTPYSIRHDQDGFATALSGAYRELVGQGYVFAFQDIRGKYGSEGSFAMVRPPRAGDEKTDESTDAYDTIEWLVKKDEGQRDFPEALTFRPGSNTWQRHAAWPPVEGVSRTRVFLRAGGKLSFSPPAGDEAPSSSYLSDPARPVPYRQRPIYPLYKSKMSSSWAVWQVDDQRHAQSRPDVLTFESEVLDSDLTISGSVVARLWASTTGSDADFVRIGDPVAARQGWSERSEGCDDFMKLRLSSSGCESRAARGEPARAGSEPCDGRGNTSGDA